MSTENIHVLSLSFGKDSMALLIEVIKRKLPLDYVIFCDIRFNKEISGEHPVMAEWIPQAEDLLKKKFGVSVLHLTAERNFEEQFYTKKRGGGHKGDIYGFPYPIRSWCNSQLKLAPIKNFFNKILKKGQIITEYIGIAKDEPQRLERYKKLSTSKHRYITLADLDISEEEAMTICADNGLLSPKYKNSFRGGCWFCPKQPMFDLYKLWLEFPHYYAMLERMEKDTHHTFRTNSTLADIRKNFECGKIPKQRKTGSKFKQLSMFDQGE